MDQQASGIGTDLELLRAQVQELERRVASLEDEKSRVRGLSATQAAQKQETLQIDLRESTAAVSLIATLGKAVLGMAGAYFLRAAAESEVIPKFAVVAAALTYAWTWQFFAVRAGKNSRIAETVFGITSALILFPMLWESTLRFRILPTGATAAILFASVLSAVILERKQVSAATLWVTVLFSLGTGLGLFVATRDPLPFVVALIVTFALTELAARRGRWVGLRIAAAIALNLALCALLYLASQPLGFPSEYKPVGLPSLLLVFTAAFSITAGAAVYRMIRLQKEIAWQEILQTIVSFALLFAAVAELAGSTVMEAFGVCCVLASLACYFEGFFGIEKQESSRNFRFYAACAGALFVIGSYFCLPISVRVPWLSACAILATVLAGKTKRVALGFHGFLWLTAVEISSGLLVYAGLLFAGAPPASAPAMGWVLLVSAAVCSFLLFLRQDEGGAIRVLRYVSVANTALLIGAFLVAIVVRILPGKSVASAAQLASVRTFLICAIVLVLALMGSRWKHRELVWMAYTAIGLGTVKLLLEDWRSGSTGSFALSLLAFGVLLAVVPRLVRDACETNEPRGIR